MYNAITWFVRIMRPSTTTPLRSTLGTLLSLTGCTVTLSLGASIPWQTPFDLRNLLFSILLLQQIMWVSICLAFKCFGFSFHCTCTSHYALHANFGSRFLVSLWLRWFMHFCTLYFPSVPRLRCVHPCGASEMHARCKFLPRTAIWRPLFPVLFCVCCWNEC